MSRLSDAVVEIRHYQEWVSFMHKGESKKLVSRESEIFLDNTKRGKIKSSGKILDRTKTPNFYVIPSPPLQTTGRDRPSSDSLPSL